jgi:hypothetical protein
LPSRATGGKRGFASAKRLMRRAAEFGRGIEARVLVNI